MPKPGGARETETAQWVQDEGRPKDAVVLGGVSISIHLYKVANELS